LERACLPHPQESVSGRHKKHINLFPLAALKKVRFISNYTGAVILSGDWKAGERGDSATPGLEMAALNYSKCWAIIILPPSSMRFAAARQKAGENERERECGVVRERGALLLLLDGHSPVGLV
jgi:hypothetical protein